MRNTRLSAVLLSVFLAFALLLGCTRKEESAAPPPRDVAASEETASEDLSEEPVSEALQETASGSLISEDGSYTTKEEVSLYLYTYGRLPGNFLTKAEARALGWEGGGLDE